MEVTHLCAFNSLLNENVGLPKYTFLTPSFYVTLFRNFSSVLCSALKTVANTWTFTRARKEFLFCCSAWLRKCWWWIVSCCASALWWPGRFWLWEAQRRSVVLSLWGSSCDAEWAQFRRCWMRFGSWSPSCLDASTIRGEHVTDSSLSVPMPTPSEEEGTWKDIINNNEDIMLWQILTELGITTQDLTPPYCFSSLGALRCISYNYYLII